MRTLQKHWHEIVLETTTRSNEYYSSQTPLVSVCEDEETCWLSAFKRPEIVLCSVDRHTNDRLLNFKLTEYRRGNTLQRR